MFYSLKRKYGVKFVYIVALLNKHIHVQRMVWAWVVMVLVVIDPIAESMMLLQTIMVVSGGMSIS